MAGTATGLPLVCLPAQLVSTPHLHLTATAPSLLTLGHAKGGRETWGRFYIFCCIWRSNWDQTLGVMNFTVILLLHINNKDMTIMIIKEGNVKIHLNFHYHDSTRSLMWVLFWTQWEHGLVAAGGGEEPSAVRRCGRYWASHPSSSRPSLSLSSSLLTLPWTQAEAGLGCLLLSSGIAKRFAPLSRFSSIIFLISMLLNILTGTSGAGAGEGWPCLWFLGGFV